MVPKNTSIQMVKLKLIDWLTTVFIVIGCFSQFLNSILVPVSFLGNSVCKLKIVSNFNHEKNTDGTLRNLDKIDVYNLSKGVYLLRLYHPKGVWVKKIIVC